MVLFSTFSVQLLFVREKGFVSNAKPRFILTNDVNVETLDLQCSDGNNSSQHNTDFETEISEQKSSSVFNSGN